VIGGDQQGRALDGPQVLRDAPADDGPHGLPVGARVVLGPALDKLPAQVLLFGLGEEALAQDLAHLAHAQQPDDELPLQDLETVPGRADDKLRAGVDDDQAPYQGSVAHSQLQGHHATQGDAHHVRRGQTEAHHQPGSIGRKERDGIRATWLVGLPVTTEVKGDHLIALAKLGHLQFPVAGTGTQPVNEQHRLALALDLVVKRDVAHLQIWHGNLPLSLARWQVQGLQR
jgi:hypothetical protein